MKKLKINARVSEIDGLSDSLVDLFKNFPVVKNDKFLADLFLSMEDLSAKITTAIKSDKVRSNLDDLDSKRDEAIRGFTQLVKAYALIPISEKQVASEKVLSVIGKYPGITEKNYTEESSLIESLLEELGNPFFAECLASLDGAKSAITSIRESQDEFRKASNEYNLANNNKGESASSIKKPLIAMINDKLVPYLDTMKMVNPEMYGDFANSIEREIERVNQAIAKR